MQAVFTSKKQGIFWHLRVEIHAELGQVIRATFSHNLSRNIVALQVEKGCFPYYHLRSQLVTQQMLMLQVAGD